MINRPSYHQGFARSAGESANPDLWRGLIHKWLMVEGGGPIRDLFSKNTYNLNTGNVWVTSRQGLVLDFDGASNAEIIVGGTSSSFGRILPTGAYTKIALVRKDANPANPNIFSGDSNSHVFWAPETFNFVDGALAAGHNGSFGLVEDSVRLALNIWWWVAVTFDPNVGSGTLKLYKNGRLVDSATSVATPTAPTFTYIGGFSGSNTWAGQIADISLYDRALSEKEMVDHYTNPWAMFELSKTIGFVAPVVDGISIPSAMRYYRNRRISCF